MVETRNDDGSDEVLVLLNKVSSQDIAGFRDRLKDIPAIREVELIRRGAANSGAT